MFSIKKVNIIIKSTKPQKDRVRRRIPKIEHTSRDELEKTVNEPETKNQETVISESKTETTEDLPEEAVNTTKKKMRKY